MESMIKDICELKSTLIAASKMEMARGIENVNTAELGEVIDMIQDLAKTEKYCRESSYYKAVVEAMEEGEEPKYGYNSNRYASGRYAPKGYGNKSGYKPFVDQEPYMDAYLHDPGFEHNMRMGYSDTPSKYGSAYHGYQNAMRHYTETNSRSDKNEMDMFANEHLVDTITTMREIYKHSDPDMRKKIKTDLTALINEIPT